MGTGIIRLTLLDGKVVGMRIASSLIGASFLAATTALPVSHVQAEIVAYTERATFEAAIVSSAAVTFSGLAPAGGYAVYPTDSTFGGVAFTRNAAGQDSMYALNGADWGQGFAAGMQNMALNSVSQTATLPGGKTAFGVDLHRLVEGAPGAWDYAGSQYATVTVTFSDEQTTTFNVDWGLAEPGALQAAVKFVGVTSSDPGLTVKSVTFSGGEGSNGSLVIDNLTYGLLNRDIVAYTDRATFEFATDFSATVTFNGLAPAGGYTPFPTDSTFGGVAFTRNAAEQGTMYALNGAGWGQGFVAGLENMVLDSVSQTATLPSGQTAFGVDLYRLVEPDGAGGWRYGGSRYATVTVTYSDDRTMTFNLDWGLTEPGDLQAAVKFVGVTSADPGLTIKSVTFAGRDEANGIKELVIDNFTYGVFERGIVTYTDRSTFETSIVSSATVTFSGLAPAGGYAIYPTDSTFDGVAFTRNVAPQENMYALNGAGWGQGFAAGMENMALNGMGQTATLPGGKTAFGVDLYRLVEPAEGYGGSQYVIVTVTYSDDSTKTILFDWGLSEPGALQVTGKFVGVTSSDPSLTIKSVAFTGSGGPYGSPVIDNLTYGKVPDRRGTLIYLK